MPIVADNGVAEIQVVPSITTVPLTAGKGHATRVGRWQVGRDILRLPSKEETRMLYSDPPWTLAYVPTTLQGDPIPLRSHPQRDLWRA